MDSRYTRRETTPSRYHAQQPHTQRRSQANRHHERAASPSPDQQNFARTSRANRSAAGHGAVSSAPSRAQGAAAYTRKRRSAGRKRTALKVLGGIAASVVLLVGLALAWVFSTNAQLQKGVDANLRQALVSVNKSDPFYMVLLGVDKSEGRANDWGDSTVNFRSDTIMLARVDPKGGKITLISIPRDTKVEIEGHGTQKINSAYSFGGPSGMVQAVSKLAGVSIAHYAEVDFDQFASIVDSIGGITVNLPIAISDEDANVDLPAGEQTLNGAQALGLSRSRHAYDSYGAGDFYRAANQRLILMAIAQKVLSLGLVEMANAASSIAGSVTTDMGVTDIVDLAYQFRGMDASQSIYSALAPTTSTYTNNLWYEVIDEAAWKTMMERVDAGESPYSDASQDKTGNATATLVGGSNGTQSSSSATASQLEGLSADYSGKVEVVNTTSVQGLAAGKATILKKAGFSTVTLTATPTREETVIMTDGSDANMARAKGVAEALGLPVSIIMKNDGSYTTTANVLIALGNDAA